MSAIPVSIHIPVSQLQLPSFPGDCTPRPSVPQREGPSAEGGCEEWSPGVDHSLSSTQVALALSRPNIHESFKAVLDATEGAKAFKTGFPPWNAGRKIWSFITPGFGLHFAIWRLSIAPAFDSTSPISANVVKPDASRLVLKSPCCSRSMRGGFLSSVPNSMPRRSGFPEGVG